MPARTRARRTATAGTPERSAISASPKPARLASSSGAPTTRRSAATSSASRSVNHGAMPVAARRPGCIGPAVAQEGDHPPQARVGRGQEGRRGQSGGRWVSSHAGSSHSPAAAARLQRADRLQQGRAELAIDRHRLAGRLHLDAQRAVRGRELVERPARQLDDDVVDGRLEGGAADAGRRVRQLVQPLAERDQGGDARDRVAGRLGGQRD